MAVHILDRKPNLENSNSFVELFLIPCYDGDMRAIFHQHGRKRKTEPGTATSNITMLKNASECDSYALTTHTLSLGFHLLLKKPIVETAAARTATRIGYKIVAKFNIASVPELMVEKWTNRG